MQATASLQPLSLKSKVDIYLNFLVKSRNRMWFDNNFADLLVRQIQLFPKWITREDFIFYFVYFAFHKMLPPLVLEKTYYPTWYFAYRQKIADSLALDVRSQPWADFSTTFNAFPYRLQAAMQLCAVRGTSRTVISGAEVHSQFYWLWCALRYKMSYWQTDQSLRVLLDELEKEEATCNYDSPLFTLDHKNYLAPPLLKMPPPTSATVSKSQQKKNAKADDAKVAFERIGFVEGCNGVGEGWFHPAQFEEARAIYVVASKKRKISSGSNLSETTQKRRKIVHESEQVEFSVDREVEIAESQPFDEPASPIIHSIGEMPDSPNIPASPPTSLSVSFSEKSQKQKSATLQAFEDLMVTDVRPGESDALLSTLASSPSVASESLFWRIDTVDIRDTLLQTMAWYKDRDTFEFRWTPDLEALVAGLPEDQAHELILKKYIEKTATLDLISTLGLYPKTGRLKAYLMAKQLWDRRNPPPFSTEGFLSLPNDCWLGLIWDLIDTPMTLAALTQTCRQALFMVCACFGVCPSWQRFKVFGKYAHLAIKFNILKHERISCYHFNPDTLRTFIDSGSFTNLREAHFHRFTLTPTDIAKVLQNGTTIRSLAFHGTILIPDLDPSFDQMLTQIRALQITEPNATSKKDRLPVAQFLIPKLFPNLAVLSLRNMTSATQTYQLPATLSTTLLFVDLRTTQWVNNFFGFLKLRNPTTTSVLQELYRLMPNLRGLRIPLAERTTKEKKVVSVSFPPPPASLEFLELFGFADQDVELNLWEVDIGKNLRHISLVNIFIRLTQRPPSLPPPDYADDFGLDQRYWVLYIGGTDHKINRRIFESIVRQQPFSWNYKEGVQPRLINSPNIFARRYDIAQKVATLGYTDLEKKILTERTSGCPVFMPAVPDFQRTSISIQGEYKFLMNTPGVFVVNRNEFARKEDFFLPFIAADRY